MRDDVTSVLEELKEVVNNFIIRGSGVTGNIRNGYVVIPGSSQISSGSGGAPPPPIPTGACCPVVGDCFVSTQDVCESGGGNYQGDGTTCTPDPCAFACGSFLNFSCIGVMCDTSGATSYTSVFNLSPGLFAPALHLSGSEGPSDFATFDWTIDMTLDGIGGYSITYGGTVTGKFSGSQDFSYFFSGTCGILQTDTHHDRFCGSGSGHCTDIFGCNADTLLAFDTGGGSAVSITVS